MRANEPRNRPNNIMATPTLLTTPTSPPLIPTSDTLGGLLTEKNIYASSNPPSQDFALFVPRFQGKPSSPPKASASLSRAFWLSYALSVIRFNGDVRWLNEPKASRRNLRTPHISSLPPSFWIDTSHLFSTKSSTQGPSHISNFNLAHPKHVTTTILHHGTIVLDASAEPINLPVVRTRPTSDAYA